MRFANKQKAQQAQRGRRRARVRMRVKGTAERPRLSVFRSHAGMVAQLINDAEGRTIVAITGRELPKETRRGAVAGADGATYSAKTAEAYQAGVALGKKAVAQGIKNVVFDKGPYQYHGRVRALADGARLAGLIF